MFTRWSAQHSLEWAPLVCDPVDGVQVTGGRLWSGHGDNSRRWQLDEGAGPSVLRTAGSRKTAGNDACGSVVEVVEGAGSGQGAKGSASIAKRPAVQSVRERWLPVTVVAIGVLSVAAILLSAGLIVLRLRRS